MQRQEIPNNTPEQVEEYVIAALKLVIDLDPPKDLRAPMFEQACALYASKSISISQPPPVDLSRITSNGLR